MDSYYSDFNYDLLLNDDYCLKFLFSLKSRLNKINDDDPDHYIIEMTQILIDEFSKYCLKKIRKKNKNNHPWINLKIKKMVKMRKCIFSISASKKSVFLIFSKLQKFYHCIKMATKLNPITTVQLVSCLG